jgi:hypothetical protein
MNHGGNSASPEHNKPSDVLVAHERPDCPLKSTRFTPLSLRKEIGHMDMDPASLKRIQTFMELIQRAKQTKSEPSFLTTPTEHGDNINVVVTINGEPLHAGMLFWDVNFLQDQGLVDTLDDDDLALGLNLTDGILEDAEKILAFVNEKLEN